MKQILLCGTKRHSGQTIVVWAAMDLMPGDQIRWNGFPWRVSAVYGTHYSVGLQADVRDKPNNEEETSH